MRAAGAKRVVRLPVSGAFHSPLMAEVVDELADGVRRRGMARRPGPDHQQRQRRAADGRRTHSHAARRAGAIARSSGSAPSSAWRRTESTSPSNAAREHADRDGEADRSRHAHSERSVTRRASTRPWRSSRGRAGAGIGMTVVTKVLIANRGEIAVRILRACRDLGLPAVVAYSEADRDTLAVRLADEAICIGPAEARKSYLNQPAVISAAMITGCDAIHPGYGFLSRGCHLRRGVRRARADLHRAAARGARAIRVEVRRAAHACRQRTADRAGQQRDRDRRARRARAGRRGRLSGPAQAVGGRRWPRDAARPLAAGDGAVAAARALGGTGRLRRRLASTSRSGSRSRGTSRCRCMVDRHGNGVHLGERDCSIQRRHQKLIEEGPSPAMDDATRERLRDLAIRSVIAAGYESAGHARVPARRARATSTSSRSTAGSRSSIRSPRW